MMNEAHVFRLCRWFEASGFTSRVLPEKNDVTTQNAQKSALLIKKNGNDFSCVDGNVGGGSSVLNHL